MRIDVVTLFPEMVEHAAQFGVVGRALTKKLWSLALWNPRSYTSDPHRTVDDRPYGGGPGMVMLAAPLEAALKAARAAQAEAGCAASRVLYLSPAGVPLTHARVTALNALAQQGTGLIVLAGRYEGIDERLLAQEVDEEIAVGDFVVSGGELPALMLMDALVRQLPGALNDQASAEEESFVDGLLDCPHYTRPPVYQGKTVPDVLLSGDHAAIASWRRMHSLGRTAARRPDLLAQRGLTKEDARLLETYQQTAQKE
ncbi:MAG: tRNA (guanosine(37)-N1)-methyltransferase TrmD [Burkholderiales bacterium]|jgi:tRNA (guanine37-N1)-methyltransferase|nr:tRNA (guanosine(37)-N1)-methyltransferase TrmD [Burkholderiales bacterium]